ncbi:MAG: hypothetical protein WEA61_09350 [Anaerolineales bacterium]
MLSTGGLKPSGIEPLGLSGESRLVRIGGGKLLPRLAIVCLDISKGKERHTISGMTYRSPRRCVSG